MAFKRAEKKTARTQIMMLSVNVGRSIEHISDAQPRLLQPANSCHMTSAHYAVATQAEDEVEDEVDEILISELPC